MQARLSFLVLLFSALLLLASPAFSAGGSTPSDEGVSPRCEAAIDKAAGNYSRCLLKASAKYAKSKKKNEDRLLAQAAKCEDKWSNQVARAQDRFGEDQCTPYVNEIAEHTKNYASETAAEAHGIPMVSVLFVQNSTGGTLSDTTLTLTDVSSKTGWFTDRPYRGSGQMNTEDFVALWDEGETFADDPPNADFTCTVDSEVVNYPVELSDPSLDGEDLSYRVTPVPVAEGVLPEALQCDSVADLFIDGGAGNTNGTSMGYGRPYICAHADQEPLGITIGGSALAGTPCYCPNMSPVDYALYNPNHVPKCSGGTFVACCIFHAD